MIVVALTMAMMAAGDGRDKALLAPDGVRRDVEKAAAAVRRRDTQSYAYRDSPSFRAISISFVNVVKLREGQQRTDRP